MGRSAIVRFRVGIGVLIFWFVGLTNETKNLSRQPVLKSKQKLYQNDSLFWDLPACQDECLWTAGANGTWIQDWEFAEEHGQYEKWAYPNGPYVKRRDRAFRPDEDSPFQWRTSWRWVDYSPNCPVDIMTKEKMCRTLTKLGIVRILFYGDSLSREMYTALMNKLGDVKVSPGFRGQLVCGEGNQTIIDTLYTSDRGGNEFPHSPRGVYDLSLKAQQFFAEAREGRVLAIFNIGAHYHNFTHYHEDIDIMLDEVSNLWRHQDLYIFRSTSPAHEGCEPRNKNFDWTRGPRISPLKSYDEYKVTKNHKFDWDAFERYNHYARERIYDHNEKGRGQPVHFLNIWNMTALRPDGHTAPADCLHYMSPGPVDWWNHMLFSYLQCLSGKAAQSSGFEETDDLRGNCRTVRQGRGQAVAANST